MDSAKLKKLSVQIMLGGLIGAATLAVIAVLAGSFNEIFAKALITLVLVMGHALASLMFIEQSPGLNKANLKFFNNAVFTIIVLSFFTSIFGVWGMFTGALVGKLYGTYFILLFASLHGATLAQALGKQTNIDNIIYVNFALMSVVVLLFFPLIWMADYDFPGFYFRLLAACGIVDATLTIMAVILHKLYLQKHPEAKNTIFTVIATQDANGNPVPVKAEMQHRRIHPLLWILGIFLIGQLVISLLFAIMGAFYRTRY